MLKARQTQAQTKIISRRSRALSAFLLIFGLMGACAGETIPAWTYYRFPPFIVDKATAEGMSYDLAALLTAETRGQFTFEVAYLPRKRLDQKLAAGEPGIVLWVNPVWFGDADRSRYLWTGALLEDRNEVLSRSDQPFVYQGPLSLRGLTLGGVLGHAYSGIDEAVAEGSVQRIDAIEERANLQNLVLQRIDVTLMPRTAARYLVRAMQLEDRIFVSPQPHRVYTRHILVPRHLSKVHRVLSDIVEQLPQNTAWRAVLEDYGFPSGSPGRIHLSEQVRRALRKRYEFEDCGLIDIRGIGEIRTSFLRQPVNVSDS